MTKHSSPPCFSQDSSIPCFSPPSSGVVDNHNHPSGEEDNNNSHHNGNNSNHRISNNPCLTGSKIRIHSHSLRFNQVYKTSSTQLLPSSRFHSPPRSYPLLSSSRFHSPPLSPGALVVPWPVSPALDDLHTNSSSLHSQSSLTKNLILRCLSTTMLLLSSSQ